MGMTHSEGLLPQLDQLLQRTGVQKQDIELLAVSMGPGSFTGLRIGLATAEAMAYSWQCCLHGVDTLKALAYNIQLEGRVLSPVLDAQRVIFIGPCTNGATVSLWSWHLLRLSVRKKH